MGRLGVLAALALVGMAGQGLAAQLEDGTYRCTLGMNAHMGDIEISDGAFRGPAYDGDYGEAYPLEVTDAGTINWGGPLGGLSSGGNTVVSTVLKDAGGGRVGFDIMIQLESGNFSTVSCSPE
ncbi:MAG TPA: hypothetical protein VGN97_01660 [Mesorhizobium sp.]|nr:hypothetical protein [Mesorhizobium sp.]